ncbi:MAG TPA: hypothetical protein DEQ64_09650 [Lachnoclostridium sp.]|uniref:LysM peptidoglycan-binding domain-containing protein n=1 Tax=Lacrimispora sp. TaxID=2719234 RepID=UPI000EEA8EB5|nr:LysM peptidoglycan-binding domain-containing protein [Lacrimispora sp.]HCD43980.1 hypothetical protein [Lachnoclostridium sp.]
MSNPRKKYLSVVYNGVEIWKDLSVYIESFSYEDSVDESDSISISLSDRDLKWSRTWLPEKGDKISPSIILENWNYEGEKMTVMCGAFLVDDFSFSCPPFSCSINGVSAPVDTGFKETQNTKTWEAATVRLIASEIAEKYGLELVYESEDIQVAKTEQDNQPDSDFLKSLCERYGLGMKIYSHRLVIWDLKQYFDKPPVLTIVPEMVSKWSYNSTMQGTYTGVKVSYTNPNNSQTVEIMVGTEERLYKTSQKADNEADARRIGESILRNANRKERTMKLTIPPKMSLYATANVQLSGFGNLDGKYFIERISHSLSDRAYDMQVSLSFISRDSDQKGNAAKTDVSSKEVNNYTVQKGDSLWSLAKLFYGDGTRCREIYEANQQIIEAEAKRRGRANSNNGYWVYPGLTLLIP